MDRLLLQCLSFCRWIKISIWITENPWEVCSEYLFTPGYVICLIKGVIDDVFVTFQLTIWR